MKQYFLVVFIILLFLSVQMHAQTAMPFYDPNGDAPEVPRVSISEAYIKYKAGKAIILHGGGESYYKRHIMGAFNLEAWRHNPSVLLTFPKRGIEIFTYCYRGRQETDGASLASAMMRLGFTNVKVVHGPQKGGGEEMGKVFEYWAGGVIVNPLTGKKF